MKLFQIFYNKETRKKIQPEFIPLDNTNALEPDWFEFEPIRKALLEHDFNDDEYIGFFSPSFTNKTGMTSKDVVNVVEKSNAEVISFSGNLITNITWTSSYASGEAFHAGFMDTFQQLMDSIGLKIKVNGLVSNQSRTIYSNYWVAKKSLWDEWLTYANKIYQITHDHDNDLAKKLNFKTTYKSGSEKMKVFIMERLINALLENKSLDAEIGTDYEKYFQNINLPGQFVHELFFVDGLKNLYIQYKKNIFMQMYIYHRDRFKNTSSKTSKHLK